MFSQLRRALELRLRKEGSDGSCRRKDPSCRRGTASAIVTITLDNPFVVRDIKIIKGSAGYVLSMPSRRVEDRTYKDVELTNFSPPTRLGRVKGEKLIA